MRLKLSLVLTIILCVDSKSQNDSQYKYLPECNFWYSQPSVVDPQTNTQNLQFNWQMVQTPVTSSFVEVFFLDSLRGWASHTGNGCMRTTDSGFNWDVTTFNDTTFSTSYNGIYFIDQNVGWCVGGAIQIRKTTNGGVSWFKQYGPPVSGINRGCWFFNAAAGYIIGSKSFPYLPFAAKTSNGGSTWSELNVSFTNAHELNDQYWFNADTGWVCGYNVLLYTTNGGASFSNLFSNVPPTGNGQNDLLAIQFVSRQTGWIGAANLERNNIYKTTNGGVSWVFQDNPVSQSGWNQINDVKFLSADSGWAAHGTPSTGAIMFTSNGGSTWLMDNTVYSWYDCFATYRRSKIWCGGSSGQMWYARISGSTGISNKEGLPDEFILYQNYPNPFNPSTKIEFSIPSGRDLAEGRQVPDFKFVSLKTFDVLGREVATLVNEERRPGGYAVTWDASGLPSGMYFYRLQTGSFAETKRLVLIR